MMILEKKKKEKNQVQNIEQKETLFRKVKEDTKNFNDNAMIKNKNTSNQL